jgi:hypothetical protein
MPTRGKAKRNIRTDLCVCYRNEELFYNLQPQFAREEIKLALFSLICACAENFEMVKTESTEV